jgi:hypothetical protein
VSESSSELEEGEEGEDHGHHVRGLAEVGHDAERNGAFGVNDRQSWNQREATRRLKLILRMC